LVDPLVFLTAQTFSPPPLNVLKGLEGRSRVITGDVITRGKSYAVEQLAHLQFDELKDPSSSTYVRSCCQEHHQGRERDLAWPVR